MLAGQPGWEERTRLAPDGGQRPKGLFGARTPGEMHHEELLHMRLRFWQAEPVFKYGPVIWKTHPHQMLCFI